MSKLSITIPDFQKKKLKEIAEGLDISLSELLRDWVSQVLASMDTPKSSK